MAIGARAGVGCARLLVWGWAVAARAIIEAQAGTVIDSSITLELQPPAAAAAVAGATVDVKEGVDVVQTAALGQAWRKPAGKSVKARVCSS